MAGAFRGGNGGGRWCSSRGGLRARCVLLPMRLMGARLEYLYFLIDFGPDDGSETSRALVAGVA